MHQRQEKRLIVVETQSVELLVDSINRPLRQPFVIGLFCDDGVTFGNKDYPILKTGKLKSF